MLNQYVPKHMVGDGVVAAEDGVVGEVEVGAVVAVEGDGAVVVGVVVAGAVEDGVAVEAAGEVVVAMVAAEAVVTAVGIVVAHRKRSLKSRK